jgi:hypothetical protein
MALDDLAAKNWLVKLVLHDDNIRSIITKVVHEQSRYVAIHASPPWLNNIPESDQEHPNI